MLLLLQQQPPVSTKTYNKTQSLVEMISFTLAEVWFNTYKPRRNSNLKSLASHLIGPIVPSIFTRWLNSAHLVLQVVLVFVILRTIFHFFLNHCAEPVVKTSHKEDLNYPKLTKHFLSACTLQLYSSLLSVCRNKLTISG